MGGKNSRHATTRDAAAWTLVHEPSPFGFAGATVADAGTAAAPSLQDAEAFCRRIATGHYENFSVISWLVPRPLRQDFANVYAFSRWSDDLADEAESPAVAAAALAAWRDELEACGRGSPRHPILVALATTIARHGLTLKPFHDLLDAFEQDQQVVRYASREQLLDYCRRSANPVGRIVLALGGCREPQRQAESDAICTGLQLINFWQDVRRDRIAGRIYLPADDMQRHGVCESDLDAPQASPALRRLLAAEVAWAEACFATGEPLKRLGPAALRPAITAFAGGGRAVADAIRRADCDTLARRPVVSKATKLILASRAVIGRMGAGIFRRSAGPAAEAEQT